MRFLDSFTIAVFILIVIYSSIWIMTREGVITLEKSYYDDYKECKAELKMIHPECPPCECSCGITGIIWGVIGFIAMLIGMIFMYKSTDTKKKKK